MGAGAMEELALKLATTSWRKGQKTLGSLKMKIFYKKDSHVIIKFGDNELKQALGVLKALAQYFRAEFIFDVAQELEDDLKPKQLTYSVYHHICEKCFCEIDTRDGNYLKVNGEWRHESCPPLKDNRGQ